MSTVEDPFEKYFLGTVNLEKFLISLLRQK